MSVHAARFQGAAEQYSVSRPTYPQILLDHLGEALRAAGDGGGSVLDVGSGTGIFSRQLRAVLPTNIPIVGIEPADDMREAAIAASRGASNLRFIGGLAEHLALRTGTACGVVAATAAHWFDRPQFYCEARRVLQPGGVLAIVEYVRDEERSPLAAALVDCLARYNPRKAYARPDYSCELPQRPASPVCSHSSIARTCR